MNLWIRSQDKEKLMKVESFDIFKTYNRNDIKSITFDIIGDGETIGKYKTKERALEILDEIQHIILNEDGVYYKQESQRLDFLNIVVEMPKE